MANSNRNMTGEWGTWPRAATEAVESRRLEREREYLKVLAMKRPAAVIAEYFDGRELGAVMMAADYAQPGAVAPMRMRDRDEGANAERTRILAALETIKPGEQPYSRGGWEMIRKAEMKMWERMRDAILNEPAVKEGDK